MPYALSRKQARDAAAFAAWQHHEAAGGPLPIPLNALKALQSGMLGSLVLPGTQGYDADRKLFNPLFNPYPNVIAYCEVEQDVGLCLAAARGYKLPFVVRAGGHSSAGYSGCDGMVIDVSRLDDVCVDARGLSATVGSGCSFGKLNSVLDPHGLHVPGGGCGDVCIGGFMQGGGFGFTSRMFGMHSDNVLEMRVMLADGRIVSAHEGRNHDLWWAVRGGTGGNFGVLLGVRYRLHRLGDVFGFAIRWPLSTAAERTDAIQGLQCLQAQYTRSNDHPACGAQAMLAMQSDKPDRSDPKPWLLLRGINVGTENEGHVALRPLLDTPGADLQWCRMGSYNALSEPLMSDPDTIPQLNPKLGMTNELKRSRYVSGDLMAADWDSIITQWGTAPNRYGLLVLELYGGAINAYAREASAFIHRDVAFDAFMDIFWYDDAEEQPARQFLDDWCNVMQPLWNGRIYQNYPSGEEPDYRANYWGEAFAGLLAIKRKYDPETLFTFPQAILPADASTMPPAIWPPRVVEAIAQPVSYD